MKVITLHSEAALVTVGIDIQDSWLAILTLAWAPIGEHWGLDWEAATGNPRDGGFIDDVVEELRHRRYQAPDGRLVPIHRMGIDSGFLRDAAWRAVDRWNRMAKSPDGPVWPAVATKGEHQSLAEPLARTVRTTRDGFGKRAVRHPLLINTNIAKEELLGGQHCVMAVTKAGQVGPRYFHIPTRFGEDFKAGLVAEKKVPKYDGDIKIDDVWVPTFERNEPLDTWCINYVLFDGMRPEMWARLERS